MSTLRITNIEAKADPSSPTVDEKIKLTNSNGDILVHIDGKTSGITTIGINTTAGNIKFDQNSNVVVTGIITATKFVGTIEPTSLEIGSNIKLGNAGVITATSYVGDGSALTGITGTTINNNADNRLITGSGTANTLEGEANLTFNGSKLVLAANSTAYDAFQVGDGLFIGNTTNNVSAAIFHQGGGADLEIGSQDMITFTTGSTAGNATERLRITSAGNVGINTGNPDRALHVFSTNGTVAHFESGNANTISQIVFEGLGASAPPNLGATGEHLHFTTNNLERVRITSGGNLGVGVVSPTSRLDVVGGGIACSGWSNNNSGASGGMELGWDGAKVVLQSIDRNGGGGFQPIFLSGSEIISSANIKFNNSGNGIDFSATSDASGMTSELLDDYEEGTSTPHLYVGSTQQSLDVSYGVYRKIGSLVFIKCHVSPSSVSGSGAVQIRNLPFTQASGGLSQTAVSIQWSGTLGEYGVYANIWRTNDVVQFARSNAGGNTGSLEGTDIGANSNFGIAGCYDV